MFNQNGLVDKARKELTSMDSKLSGGLPLSAAPQGRTPSKVSLSTSPGSSSFLIRAPPTVDSDSNGSYDSDSGFESQGFLSGEDGFETASERPFVADPDDENVGEGTVVGDNVVSRPNFTDPDGEFREKSVLGDEFAGSGPPVPDPDGRIGDQSVFRPFVPTLMTTTDEEGEYRSYSEPEVVDVGVPAISEVVVPKAVVSRDSDDDFDGIEEVEEDDEPIRAVRAIVKVVEVEDEVEEQEFESLVEDDVIVVKDTVDHGSNKLMEEKDSVDNSIEQPLAEETNDTHLMDLEASVAVRQGIDDAGEAKVDSSMGSKNDGFREDVETNEDFAYSVGEIQRLEIMEEQESEAKDDPPKYSVLGEAEATFDVSSSLNDNTVESKGANAKDVEFDVTELGNSVSFETECGKEDQNWENKGNVGEITSIDWDIDNEALEGKSDSLQPVNDEVKDEADLPRHSETFSFSDDDSKSSFFGNSDAAKVVMDDPEQSSSLSSFGESSEKHLQTTQRSMFGNSDDEVDTDGENEAKELFGSDVLAALLKAASGAGSNRGNNGRGESEENLSEEEKKRLEKLQQIRVKFLRLIRRLGLSPEDSTAAQVLYRLDLAAGRSNTQLFDLGSAKRTALELETENKDNLDFSLNILVLGKTGVGKSATINSILGENRARVDAFEPSTTSVKVIDGSIDGVKVRIFDTPGLRSSQTDHAFNRRVLLSIKKSIRKCPLDIVLYVDRLDTQTRDLGDLPLLRSVTGFLGSPIWSNAIVTLTHAGSNPPDGPTGSPLSRDLFVAQRSRVIQQIISQSTGDLHMLNPGLMSPVSLVENHPAKGGDNWRPELLLLCYSMKILSEENSLERTLFDHKKLFGFRSRSAPLLYFLSSLLQPNTHPKLPTDQGGDNIDSDNELGDFSDSDLEDDEDEYDQLPPFKPLKRSQIDNLSKEQRKAYFEEYDYRVRLLQKKQIKELKKRGKEVYVEEIVDEESDNPASVAVPLPDMSLPHSFDSDNPSHRYRFLEPASQLLVSRPVLDPQGWDHDCGYDGVSLDTNLAVAGSYPAAAAVQITKDKKDFNFHLDSSVSAKHGKCGSTMAGLAVQAVGNQLAYVLIGEMKMKTRNSHKVACGLSLTFLGKNVATGVKIGDRVGLGKRLVLSGTTGLIRCDGDTACGANIEVRVREREFPIGQDETTVGLSVMRWRGELIWGGNLESRVSVGRSCKTVVRAGLNSKLSGQVSVRTSSSDQVQIALLGIVPIANAVFRYFFTGNSKMY